MTLEFDLEAKDPGPFSATGEFYVDCDGLHILPFAVRGTATAR